MHQYPMHTAERTTAEGLDIHWQQGPIGAAFNGATVEVVIRAAAAKLDEWQAGPMRNDFNAHALTHLMAALAELDARTRDRYRRGVMGSEAR